MFARLIEILLGLKRGFLSLEGDFALQFNPRWPWQETLGAAFWNVLLGVGALALILWVYRKDGRSRRTKIILGMLRTAAVAVILILLNRPVASMSQQRTEPSVVAVLVDDSASMRIGDAGNAATPTSRLDQIRSLLSSGTNPLLASLPKNHEIKIYRFDEDASLLSQVAQTKEKPADATLAASALAALKPEGRSTELFGSLRRVMDELSGQRVAGVIVLTDGREAPAHPLAEQLEAIRKYGIKVFPVAIGADAAPRNIAVTGLNVQETAFKGDLVSARVALRTSGYPAGTMVELSLVDARTGRQLPGPEGGTAKKSIRIDPDRTTDAEIAFKPEEVGTMDVAVVATGQAGEVDEEDNRATAQISVLDAKISVLYVDGYPRWEYRYIKNEMIRDKTVDISCLLTSADPTFAQEGDKPIRRFPESIEELLAYDVVLLGDVSPREFSDAQLQLIADFVGRRGGGFGMIAGPRWSPFAWKGTALEPVLPVALARPELADDGHNPIDAGFRLALTPVGEESSIFRFFADRERNQRYLKEELQNLFWYGRGVIVKPGVGETYAEHPSDTGPDGRKAPILVLGRYGAGRTLFSAIDDSWRFRYYTGESVFDTYWVQQLRYLARSKKLGQRRVTLASQRANYELGQQARVTLRILDPQLVSQLPDQLTMSLTDETGQTIRQEPLVRQEGQADTFVASFPADHVGRFTVRVGSVAAGIESLQTPIEISVPKLELAEPRTDRGLLARLAAETMGQSVPAETAASVLPGLLPSAARVVPVQTSQPLWNAPLAMGAFVLLIITEWVFRKLKGMV